ncbi:hypothetical protein Tco_1262744 [Tanacetum coccineum]
MSDQMIRTVVDSRIKLSVPLTERSRELLYVIQNCIGQGFSFEEAMEDLKQIYGRMIRKVGLLSITDIFSIKEKIWDGGGRKITTACKGYYFDVSMSNIGVNKLHHMEYANGCASWNSWSLGCEGDVESSKTRNLGADCVKKARLQTLIMEFVNMKMSYNDTIDAYVAKLSGIVTQEEGDDVVRTLEVVVEVVVKDVVEATINTKANVTLGKTVKIISKRGSNMSNVISRI